MVLSPCWGHVTAVMDKIWSFLAPRGLSAPMSDRLGNLMGGERRRGHVRNAYPCGHKTESSETIDLKVFGQSRITVVLDAQSAHQEFHRKEARCQAGFRRAQGPVICRRSTSCSWSGS